MSAFCTIRSAILFSIFVGRKPGRALLDDEALDAGPSPRRAPRRRPRSAKVALPIHRLAPLRTQCRRPRCAVVCMPPATSEPPCGSVSPKAPIFSKRLIAGSHRRRCSSDPQADDGAHASPACTPKNVATDASAWANSIASEAHRELLGGFSSTPGPPSRSGPSLTEPVDELEREFGPRPVIIDDRRRLAARGTRGRARLFPLLSGQQVLVGVEVRREAGRSRTGLRPCRQGQCQDTAFLRSRFRQLTSGLEEGEQVGVDRVGVRSTHAVRELRRPSSGCRS